MLADLKSRESDRELVNAWLDKINEHDPGCRAEVLEQCKNDIEARRFYVRLATGEFI